jgi:hypothetical protein
MKSFTIVTYIGCWFGLAGGDGGRGCGGAGLNRRGDG